MIGNRSLVDLFGNFLVSGLFDCLPRLAPNLCLANISVGSDPKSADSVRGVDYFNFVAGF